MPGRAGLAMLRGEGGGDDPLARQPACPALPPYGGVWEPELMTEGY